MTFTYIVLMMLLLSLSADSSAVKADCLKVGDVAPMFFAHKIGSGDFFLSKLVGEKAHPDKKRPIVLNFFTTSCIPCRREIPYIHTLHEEYPKYSIYLVNIGENESKVKKYISKMEYTLPVLHDKYGVISKKYKASATPTFVIITEGGKISYYKRGFKESDTELIQQEMQKLSGKIREEVRDTLKKNN